MTFTGFLKQFMHNVMMNYGGVRENTSFFCFFTRLFLFQIGLVGE